MLVIHEINLRHGPCFSPAQLLSSRNRPWWFFVTSSHTRLQPPGVGGRLLSSLQSAWRAGAPSMSPLKSLGVSEGNPQLLRLFPQAVLSAAVIHEVMTRAPRPPTFSACRGVQHGRWSASAVCVESSVPGRWVGSVRARPPPILRQTLAQASLVNERKDTLNNNPLIGSRYTLARRVTTRVVGGWHLLPLCRRH